MVFTDTVEKRKEVMSIDITIELRMKRLSGEEYDKTGWVMVCSPVEAGGVSQDTTAQK